MKLYKFDKESLSYKNIATSKFFIIGFVILLSSIGITSLLLVKNVSEVRFISEETKAIIINESDKHNKFAPEKLKAYILELNVKYPHIVYAQAVLESGNFKSKLFRENNNLFGMRQAKRRPTTNKGEENGYAFYLNWKECVVDYAMYSAAYLNGIKSESDYFQYLSQNYAEDTSYVIRLKEIINRQKSK